MEGPPTAVPHPDPLVHRRRWWILAVLILSLFTVNLDNTILNVALPTLALGLHASLSQLQWIIDAYVLVFAGLLLVAGALGDRFGRRRVLVVGLVIFGAGSVTSAFAPSADILIPLRALMGLGGALITPSTLSITRHVFTAEERPRAIAVWTATAGLGIVAGPVIAGVLLDHFAWGSIFLINIPVVIAALVGIAVLIPEFRSSESPRLDVLGAILSVGTLVGLVYGTIEAPAAGWTEPRILAALGLALVLAVAFVAHELCTADPMIDLRIFRRRALAGGTLAVLLSSLGMMGSMFFLSVYLQSVVGFTTLETGLGVLPLAVGMALASAGSALGWRRLGARITVVTGMAGVAAGLVLLAQSTPTSGYPIAALAMFALGAGMGLAASPVTFLMIQAIPASRAGVASAVNSTARELGGALGVAILGSISAPVYASGVHAAAAALPVDAGTYVSGSLPGALEVAAHLPAPVSDGLATMARAAFIHGMTGAVVLGAFVALAGAVTAALTLPGRAATIAAAATPSIAVEARAA